MVGDWRKYLCETEEDEELPALRREARVGRPLGNREFLRKLEARLDRRLLRRQPGRRPKERIR
jgi:putative transposase